jgi:hypothetical protein
LAVNRIPVTPELDRLPLRVRAVSHAMSDLVTMFESAMLEVRTPGLEPTSPEHPFSYRVYADDSSRGTVEVSRCRSCGRCRADPNQSTLKTAVQGYGLSRSCKCSTSVADRERPQSPHCCQSQPSALRQIDVGKVGGRDKHKNLHRRFSNFGVSGSSETPIGRGA